MKQTNPFKPINQLFVMGDTYLDELYDRLWYEYWCPITPHTKEMKSYIREQLNTVVEQWNKIVGAESLMAFKEVKATDTWVDDGNAPEWPNKIYADVRPAIEKPKHVVANKPAKAAPTEKVEKAKSPCLVGKKGTYDEVAALADKGLNKDQIQEQTGFARKFITDSLWRWNKNKTKS